MRTASFLISLVLAGSAAAEMKFIDRAPALGLTHEYDGGWEHFVGGGLAVFDCDSDGLEELYAAGGANPAALFRNHSEIGGPLNFEEETPEALALTAVTGAYPIDIDSDGAMDLAVLRVGENHLLKGEGDCTFTPFEGLNFDGGDRWTTAFTATWEAGQTLPTLAFGNYVNRDDPEGPFEACDVNHLFRPETGGYAPPITLKPGFCALSMLFTDWGRRGRADLRISNDRHYYIKGGSEQLWAMDADPYLYDARDGWRTQSLWGMGIASRDLTGDGRAEIALTSMGDQIFQYPDPAAKGPRYDDAPFETGATAHRPYTGGDGRPSTGWHAEFGDLDNDGRDDLFIAKGNVDQMPSMAMKDPNNLLRQREDGTFEEIGLSAGVASLARGRGAALADLNLDGRLDIVVVNRRAPIEISENTGETGAHLLLRLTQPGPNRDAIGAHVEVKTAGGLQTQELTVGGGHAGGHTGWLHFGLGEAGSAQLRVIWPDGQTSTWIDAPSGRRKAHRQGDALALK